MNVKPVISKFSRKNVKQEVRSSKKHSAGHETTIRIQDEKGPANIDENNIYDESQRILHERLKVFSPGINARQSFFDAKQQSYT